MQAKQGSFAVIYTAPGAERRRNVGGLLHGGIPHLPPDAGNCSDSTEISITTTRLGVLPTSMR
jgi:hypothetical protein